MCPPAAGIRGSLRGGVSLCARGDRARLEPPLPPSVAAWGPSAAPPACPRPPCAARQPSWVWAAERRRPHREARPGAGGRRATTAFPQRTSQAGGGVQANGRPGEGLGRGWGGAGPRPPHMGARASAGRPGGEDAEATIPLCSSASGAQRRAFPGAHRPPFEPPEIPRARNPLPSPCHVLLISCLSQLLLLQEAFLTGQVPDSPWDFLCPRSPGLGKSASSGIPAWMSSNVIP